MTKNTLTLTISDDTGESQPWNIKGIPAKVWSEFRRRCVDLHPEGDKSAWAEVFRAFIKLVPDSENENAEALIHLLRDAYNKEFVCFNLWGIPAAARDRLTQTVEAAQIDEANFVSSLYRAAYNNKLRVVANTEAPDDSYSLVVHGIPPEAWQQWQNMADKLSADSGESIPPVMLVARILGTAHLTDNNVSFVPNGVPNGADIAVTKTDEQS